MTTQQPKTQPCTKQLDCPAEEHTTDCAGWREHESRAAYDDSEWHFVNEFDY